MLFIDFETRSESDIKKVGAYKYASHSSTSILCLAYKINDKDTEILKKDWDYNTIPYDLKKELHRGEYTVAHNAFFEESIWNEILVKRYNWPRVVKWVCTQALGQYQNLPASLNAMGTALGLPIKKDMDGQRIMLKLCKPRKPSINNPNKWFDGADDLKKLYEYCITDVDVTYRIYKELWPKMPRAEQAIWELNNKINLTGIPINSYLISNSIKFINQYELGLTDELMDITQGQITSTGQVARLIKFLKAFKCTLSDLTKESVEHALLGDIHPTARRLLEIRQGLGGTATKKLDKFQQMGVDGRIYGTILYCGASTARFSGRGIQPQNMTKGNESDIAIINDLINIGDYELFRRSYQDINKEISKCVRSMIQAPEGKEFLCLDFSAIEARVLAWQSGQENLLKQFRKNEDPYTAMASTIYRQSTDAIIKKQRGVGKAAILGLGYQMGHETFHATCLKNGIDIDKQFSTDVVRLYRERHPQIKQLWYDTEEAAKSAVLDPGSSHIVGKTKWVMRLNALHCVLPSGRSIIYNGPRLRVEQGKYGLKRVLYFTNSKGLEEQTYGGKLVENTIQGIARDLLCVSMLKLNKIGYKIILHVHDEILCEVKEGEGSLEEMGDIMSIPPSWAKGLPLGAEGWRGKWYRK